MKVLNVLLSIAVSLAMFLLCFEGGLRLLGFGPPRTLNQFDARLGWAKEPDATVHRKGKGFEVTFEINAHGLRDDAQTGPEKPADTFRAIVLGDSFALGFAVQRDDLFVDQLERKWNGEGRRVDVVNTGTEAYATDQEVAWLLENGDDYDPDLVILAPYENDLYWCSQDSYMRFPKPRFAPDGALETGDLADPGPAPWIGRTAIGRLLGLGGGGGTGRFQPAGGGRALSREFVAVLEDPPPNVIGDALPRARGALTALKTKCDELGAQLLVAPIPSHSGVDDEFRALFGSGYLDLPSDKWSPDVPVEFYLDTCAALGIRTVDAREALRAATTAGEDCYFNLFEDQEWHLNPAGNRVFADVIHAGVQEFLPAVSGEATAAVAAKTDDEGGPVPTWLIVYGVLFTVLTSLYFAHYRDEKAWQPPLKIGGLLAVIFCIFFGATRGIAALPDAIQQQVLILLVIVVLGFVAWKLGRRLATIAELMLAFMLRGHWYLMPVVVVLLTVGSLLVVAASSPLVAPFIYTLF